MTLAKHKNKECLNVLQLKLFKQKKSMMASRLKFRPFSLLYRHNLTPTSVSHLIKTIKFPKPYSH